MPLAVESHQELQLEADEAADWRLEMEPGAIDTLMQNLVGNALQHSPTGALIRIVLEAGPAALTIAVEDQGPGIPVDQREQVLQRFHRAGPGAGAGLGLSIVDRLLQRHRGRLWLGDAPGGGLSVTVSLPRTPRAA
jgi:two-component system sensor histidine kinase QseC